MGGMRKMNGSLKDRGINTLHLIWVQVSYFLKGESPAKLQTQHLQGDWFLLKSELWQIVT